jgi:ABC-type nitrate/sulfonate/bicarbonate transport system substrate-binding protein
MPADISERCDAIEACYEYMLGYAGQGLPADRASPGTSEIRNFLQRAAQALSGLANAYDQAVRELNLEPREKYQAFLRVLDRDAGDALAAIELALAQPAISSQLIDNLNASLHIRALLTDLFLIDEILEARKQEQRVVTS